MSLFQEKVSVKGLTFDDVLLTPAYSEVLLREVSTLARFACNITLNTLIVLAAAASKQYSFVRMADSGMAKSYPYGISVTSEVSNYCR